MEQTSGRYFVLQRYGGLGRYLQACYPADCAGACGRRSDYASCRVATACADAEQNARTPDLRHTHAWLAQQSVSGCGSVVRSEPHSARAAQRTRRRLELCGPPRRQCGDIDLYIGTKDYDRACELVRQHYGPDEHAIESVKHYHFKHHGVTLELHRIAEQLPQPCQNSRFQRWTVEHLHGNNLRTVEIEGATIYLPPVDFDALYIFNHAWHHFSTGGGIGLRQLCDWARFLHTFQGEIDHQALRCHLKAFGLWRAWRIFGGIVVGALGLPAAEFPFYTDKYARHVERALEIIGREGNFGFFDATRTKRPKGYLAGKLHSFIRMNRRLGRLLPLHLVQISSVWSSYIYKGIKQVMIDKRTSRKSV